jgi:hypothetical protein
MHHTAGNACPGNYDTGILCIRNLYHYSGIHDIPGKRSGKSLTGAVHFAHEHFYVHWMAPDDAATTVVP